MAAAEEVELAEMAAPAGASTAPTTRQSQVEQKLKELQIELEDAKEVAAWRRKRWPNRNRGARHRPRSARPRCMAPRYRHHRFASA